MDADTKNEIMLLNIQRAAMRLGLSAAALYRLVERKKIPHRRLGGTIRFTEEDLSRFVEICRVDAAHFNQPPRLRQPMLRHLRLRSSSAKP
jgi:excisionase family DNA binding protein